MHISLGGHGLLAGVREFTGGRESISTERIPCMMLTETHKLIKNSSENCGTQVNSILLKLNILHYIFLL